MSADISRRFRGTKCRPSKIVWSSRSDTGRETGRARQGNTLSPTQAGEERWHFLSLPLLPSLLSLSLSFPLPSLPHSLSLFFPLYLYPLSLSSSLSTSLSLSLLLSYAAWSHPKGHTERLVTEVERGWPGPVQTRRTHSVSTIIFPKKTLSFYLFQSW